MLDPNNIDYLNELAAQKLKQLDIEGCLKIYTNILTTKDSNNSMALLGKLRCNMLGDDMLDDVEEQFNNLERNKIDSNSVTFN